MLRSFTIEQDHIIEDRCSDTTLAARLSRAHWIDALAADDTERAELARFLTAELPADEDVEEIESSARYFIDPDGIHVHSLFLAQSEGGHETETVAFILQNERLITLRDTDLADFRLLRMRARVGQVEAASPDSLLVTIFEQKAENLADNVEDIHLELEKVSHNVLEEGDSDYEAAIDALAKLEDSCGKIRLCLMDTQRSVSFIQRHLPAQSSERETAREILSDVDTLMSHIAFLFDKINFLMDSTVSFMNIEQSQIIKIFSVVAVIFLPPTLIGTIYGMNFDYMPALHWKYSYPLFLFVMFAAGIAPYLYFKYRKWL